MRPSPNVCLARRLHLASPDHLHPVIGRDLEYFSQAGFDMEKITLKRNAPIALLYEDAIRNEGAIISSTGALINFSGKKTGRSPKDKRIVYEETSKDDIWWGSVNIKMDERMSCQLFSCLRIYTTSSPRHFRNQS
jgi:phosphoenolpyruvate carboxykinase (ATP)